MSVEFIAKRMLGKLVNYHDLTSQPTVIPDWMQRLPMRKGEVPLGIYQNIPDRLDESIVVTNFGIYIHDTESWEYISYGDIDAIQELPRVREGPDKLKVTGLSLQLSNGQVREIPIRGRTKGQILLHSGESKIEREFPHVWEFFRFLLRATEILKRDMGK